MSQRTIMSLSPAYSKIGTPLSSREGSKETDGNDSGVQKCEATILEHCDHSWGESSTCNALITSGFCAPSRLYISRSQPKGVKQKRVK